MANTQFNFELPESEAARLLDVGVERKMGLTRETVQKSMVARALVLERLEQVAPRAKPDEAPLHEFISKLQVEYAANPATLTEHEKLLAKARRTARRTAA